MGKKIGFYFLASLLTLSLASGGIILTDLYLHYHLGKQQGYNHRGHRGKILSKKKEGEYRVACFGGSTTYGYGNKVEGSYPYYLEQYLNTKKDKIYSVANLGYNGQGILGINYDIKHYNYLNYDMAIIYNGYNDSKVESFNDFVFRDDFFSRTFNYKLILPLYLREKSKILRFGKDGKNAQNDFFRFQLGNGMSAAQGMFTSAMNILNQFNQRAKVELKKSGNPYDQYLKVLDLTFDYLLSKGKKVVFVCQPNMYDTVIQKSVRKLLTRKYQGKVTYLNFSDLVGKFTGPFFSDGLHLTKEGNQRVARSLSNFIHKRKL